MLGRGLEEVAQQGKKEFPSFVRAKRGQCSVSKMLTFAFGLHLRSKMWRSQMRVLVRCPTMEPVFVKKLPRFRGFLPWNFGVPRDISPNLTFDPVLTNSDLF